MKPLNHFYVQQEIYQEVKKFFFDHLKEITIKKAFAGESTEGILEAKNTLSNAFKQLEDTYGAKPDTKAITSNE